MRGVIHSGLRGSQEQMSGVSSSFQLFTCDYSDLYFRNIQYLNYLKISAFIHFLLLLLTSVFLLT